MARYAFVGHAVVRDHVARCLEPLGWMCAADVADADVVFSYCVSAAGLEDAYFDEEGLVKRAKPGALLVDLSASTPSFARELSVVADVNDLRPIEAPLSVVDPTVPDPFDADNLLCYVAGEQDDVDEVIDVLETIAGTVERTGSCGTAQLAKAARTIQVAAALASAVEAEALVRATRDASMVLEGVDASVRPALPGIAPLLSAVAAESFDGAYTVEMFMAEVAAALAAADDVELILPQLEAVMHLLEVIAVIGGADKSPTALSFMYREEAKSAAHGLDWTRAEGLFSDYEREHDHDHGYEPDDDDFGMYGGFSGYSSN